MAKRKSRTRSRKKNRPNIPQETLERARQGVEDEGASALEDESEVEISVSNNEFVNEGMQALAAAQELARLRAERYERRANTRSKKRTKKGTEPDSSVVAELLANPTTEVSKEDLKKQYNYVLLDLRNMGILAAVLFVILIGLGFTL